MTTRFRQRLMRANQEAYEVSMGRTSKVRRRRGREGGGRKLEPFQVSAGRTCRHTCRLRLRGHWETGWNAQWVGKKGAQCDYGTKRFENLSSEGRREHFSQYERKSLFSHIDQMASGHPEHLWDALLKNKRNDKERHHVTYWWWRMEEQITFGFR